MASRLCGKVFDFVKENLSEPQRRRAPLARKGVPEKGRPRPVPAAAHSDPGARIHFLIVS